MKNTIMVLFFLMLVSTAFSQKYILKINKKDGSKLKMLVPDVDSITFEKWDSSVPILSSPLNNAVDIPTPVTFSWNAAAYSTSYSLQVSTDNGFSSFIYNQTGLTATVQLVSGLSINTKYYWRVNSMNSYETTGWSDVWNFRTSFACSGLATVSYGGIIYNTVQIGTQCWLKENLNIGTKINSSTLTDTMKNDGIIEKYCYNNDTNNCNLYGGFYQWKEAMQYSSTPGAKGICPDGWHIPTLTEIQTLGTEVGGNSNELKALGQGSGAGAGTNTSGFTGLLAGVRFSMGEFLYIGQNFLFWTSSLNGSSSPYALKLNYNDNVVEYYSNSNLFGFSVRCLHD